MFFSPKPAVGVLGRGLGAFVARAFIDRLLAGVVPIPPRETAPYLFQPHISVLDEHCADFALIAVALLLASRDGLTAISEPGETLFRGIPERLALLRRIDCRDANAVLQVIGVEHGYRVPIEDRYHAPVQGVSWDDCCGNRNRDECMREVSRMPHRPGS